MADEGFHLDFEKLTGHKPFPWQEELYKRFCKGAEAIPQVGSIPTGLGKTSLVGIWLLALIKHPEKLPRRLVYVVNRRTVVDQTTAEVLRLREKLPVLDARFTSLGVSTLRGQFADNHEWSEDPSRPAVICGTVDMIGSRLLFGGYRLGFKSRPLHAGFLGQDVLIVHDESHLEPAFQQLIETIQREQDSGENARDLPWPKLRVMALSATARTDNEDPTTNNAKRFALTQIERNPPEALPDTPTEPLHHVWRRLKAKKHLRLSECEDEKSKLTDKLVDLALELKQLGAAVLIFVRRVEQANDVQSKLGKELNKAKLPVNVASLTGTMRGYERDALVRSNPVFVRFMSPEDRPEGITPAEGTAYLVCTSAGEVGVNLSAHHMVCDLSTFDSMTQRLGRVNRFGNHEDTRIDVVYPCQFDNGDKDDKLSDMDAHRKNTLALLRRLPKAHAPKVDDDVYDASPYALGALDNADSRTRCFAPQPTILPGTDILFDAWAMTSIKGNMPGRPPLSPYLHGVSEWEPPRTAVGWREEVAYIVGDLLVQYSPEQLLEDYPLKPHELLSDRTDRVLDELQKIAGRSPDAPGWLVDDRGNVESMSLSFLADPAASKKAEKRRLTRAIADRTVLLPPHVGGLSQQGTLAGECQYDPAQPDRHCVADEWYENAERAAKRRVRIWDNQAPPEGMALIRTIDLKPDVDEFGPLADEEPGPRDLVEPSAHATTNGNQVLAKRRFWHWYVRPPSTDGNETAASVEPVRWDHHTADVVARARQTVKALRLPDDLAKAVILAAKYHDLGKKRQLWQRSIGNPKPHDWHAKPGKPSDSRPWRPQHLSDYRHEFGSVLDLQDPNGEHCAELTALDPNMRDLALHLIAAHHGLARPHFSPEGIVDPERSQAEAETEALEVLRRYARLQRMYGRWGLAYIESLIRAADWAASAEPSKPVRRGVEAGENWA